MTQPPGFGYGPTHPPQYGPGPFGRPPQRGPVPPPFGSVSPRQPRSARWSLIAGAVLVAVWLVVELALAVVRGALGHVHLHGDVVLVLLNAAAGLPALVLAIGVALAADPAIRSRVWPLACAALTVVLDLVWIGMWIIVDLARPDWSFGVVDGVSKAVFVLMVVLLVAGWVLGHRRRAWTALVAVPAGLAAYGTTLISWAYEGDPNWILINLQGFALGDLPVMVAAVVCCWLAVLLDRVG